MDAAYKITRRGEKLLRKEGYIRRERYVCLGLSLVILIGITVMSFVAEDPSRMEVPISGAVTAIFCFLGYAYYCTLLIQHIETIKHSKV